MADTLNWGILGTGNIAKKFAQDIQSAPKQRLVAVGSRTAEAAQKFGAEFKGIKCHGSYEALIADPDVQAIYISLPNHLHKEWTIRCAKGKKHILCEKPLAVTRAEADAMLEAVKASGVFFMEAFMYRCHPQTFKLRELLASGAIGEVRLIHADFSYNMGPQYTNIRLSNPAAGGGLMDVGCYPISIARLIAGCEPCEVKAVGKIGPVSRVDEQAAGVMLFPNGIVASITCATQVNVGTGVTIFGSEGDIHIPVPWKPPAKAKMVLKRKGAVEEVVTQCEIPLYGYEALHVSENLSKLQSPVMTWADSIGNQVALDALRNSMGLKFDCE
jgi:predicted dehydrogenase